MHELYCGIDIGTSSVKAMVYDQDLQCVFSISGQYDFAPSRRDRAELNPDDVYSAVVTCLRACVEHAQGTPLRFISFSSALHSLIAVDASGRPLTNCITWADMRATEFNHFLRSCCEGRIYIKTGCPGHSIYMPGKILWLREYQPDVYESVAKFITIKEYVLKQLTGEWVVDYGVASGGGLLNLNDRQWDRELMEVIGISPAQLSRLVDGPTVVRMLPDAVQDIGDDIPLVVGSGDGQLANLGAGALRSGHFVATIGSSGAIRVFSPEPILDQQQRTWCYRLDADAYLTGGAINNGGLVLNWLIENCFKDGTAMARSEKGDIYDILNDYASDIPAGSNGLLFLPFLTGERSPDWNSKARGLIIGLSLSHSHKALVKAAMEGIVMRLYANFLILREIVGDREAVVVTGGFTRSRVWLQIMADIFGTRLLLYENTVDSTLGAVLMGFKAINRIETYDQLDLNLPLKEKVAPSARNAATYRDLHRLHEEAYTSNTHLFEKLYQFRKDHADKNSNHAEVLL